MLKTLLSGKRNTVFTQSKSSVKSLFFLVKSLAGTTQQDFRVKTNFKMCDKEQITKCCNINALRPHEEWQKKKKRFGWAKHGLGLLEVKSGLKSVKCSRAVFQPARLIRASFRSQRWGQTMVSWVLTQNWVQVTENVLLWVKNNLMMLMYEWAMWPHGCGPESESLSGKRDTSGVLSSQSKGLRPSQSYEDLRTSHKFKTHKSCRVHYGANWNNADLL